MNGTGPRSGPAGATAPARRKARSQASGASARRLREKILSPGARRLRERKNPPQSAGSVEGRPRRTRPWLEAFTSQFWVMWPRMQFMSRIAREIGLRS